MVGRRPGSDPLPVNQIMHGLPSRAGSLLQTSGSFGFSAARISESLNLATRMINDTCQLEPHLFVGYIRCHGAVLERRGCEGGREGREIESRCAEELQPTTGGFAAICERSS